MSQHRPAAVLKTLWANLEAGEARGEAAAAHIRAHLRIVVAGGDGTITWVLGSIMELGLTPAPPVAALPLGTGNDLSLNFGWGTQFSWAWVRHEALYASLKRYKDAEVRSLDCWRVEMAAPAAGLFQETPHSMRVAPGDPRAASALFWNYFSIGLDAAAAYGFHALREAHPRLAAGRLANQAWYSWFSCASGWFCGAPPLAATVRLRVRDAPDAAWRDLALPRSVRAVVLLNLQSYGGGRDVWGLANTGSMPRKGFSPPIYDDGRIEVVGLRSGWHTAVVMGQLTPRIHAKRLAQCCEVELELASAGGGGPVRGEGATTHMQLDGEPWPQPIPAAGGGGAPLRLRVSRAGQSRVLLNAADAQGPAKAQQLTQRGAGISRGVSEESGSAAAAAASAAAVDGSARSGSEAEVLRGGSVDD